MVALAMVALNLFHPGMAFNDRRPGKPNYFNTGTNDSSIEDGVVEGQYGVQETK